MNREWMMVALGGALGSTLRFAVALGLRDLFGGAPIATLLVNSLGSCVIGICAAVLPLDAVHLRAFLMTGILGGFTTMSTFSLEVVRFLGTGRWAEALLYVMMTLFFCFGGAFLGFALAGARP